MTIFFPCLITSRLLPGIRIGDATISIEYADISKDGRDIYRYFIDGPDWSYTGEDLSSGCQGGSLQEGLASLLSFLGACAESYQFTAQTGRKGEHNDLFPKYVADWACTNSDEIGMLSIELEEGENLIEE